MHEGTLTIHAFNIVRSKGGNTENVRWCIEYETTDEIGLYRHHIGIITNLDDAEQTCRNSHLRADYLRGTEH